MPKAYDIDDVEASFVAGDDQALRRAYDAHGRLVYTLCRRSLGSDAATDVTQEVFAAGWFARRQYDPSRGSLGGWLVGIARNKVIDHLRAQGRRPSTVGTPSSDLPAALTEAEVESLADRLLLADALAQLPDRPKRLIELAFFEQLTHPEIAERCDLPIGTVKSDIRRGLARMRRHLEPKP
ncbi:MAG: sigma-70 family RNA polymerase sigma factor [Actinobacteria bacterium]|nr:sigma-70 family RNA polymerase sigma factor [Actinomycetota bacterium]MSX88994.1 sigma-70 family RNA polymerase sigma factor [Actinomycetota bacterium]MSY72225.1 sigma-70 family RNA polymerase sigma factor [Actinomycetota bacterium]